jgi:hypothetical protein
MDIPVCPLSDEELADIHISHGLNDLMLALEVQRSAEQVRAARSRIAGIRANLDASRRFSTSSCGALTGDSGTSIRPHPLRTALVA